MRRSNEAILSTERSRMNGYLGVYAGHLRVGDLGVRHFAVVDDVAGEGILVAGHVHRQE